MDTGEERSYQQAGVAVLQRVDHSIASGRAHPVTHIRVEERRRDAHDRATQGSNQSEGIDVVGKEHGVEVGVLTNPVVQSAFVCE